MIDPNTLFSEASCFRCNSDASLSDLLKLALLQRIADAGGGGGGGTPGGAASSVQFNDAGAFGGFGSFNSGTSVLTIPGDLLFNTNNTDDIGASGGNMPRTGYFGTSVVTPLVTIPANANANAIAVTGYSLTAANAQHMLDLAGTWNTTGAPFGIRLSITNTASGSGARLINLLAGAAGASSMFSVDTSGVARINNSAVLNATANEVSLAFYRNGVSLSSTGMFTFGSGAAASGVDTAFARNSAGIAEVNSGVSGTFRDLWARHLRLATAFTVGTLPVAGVAGRMAYVTDATAPTYLGALVGGGAVVCPVFDNGAAWVST